jgi:hypothetical protein
MLFPRKALCGLLGLALVLSAAPARAADAGKYVPADAEMVLHVNIQQLLSSQLGKKFALPPIRQALRGNKEAQQLLTVLGLDPLKDITSLTISNAGQTGDKAQMALRGKFDLDKIQATAQKVAEDKKDAFKITKVGGKPLYEADQQGKTVYGAFADDSTLVVSPSRDYVVDALNGKTGKINKNLQDAIGLVDGKQSLWAAIVVTDDLKNLAATQPQAAEVAKKLKAISAGINVTDAVAVALKIRTTDPKSATEFGKAANEAKGALALIGQTNEELKPFVDELLKTLQIKTQRSDISVEFKLSEEIIEKAIKKLPGQ